MDSEWTTGEPHLSQRHEQRRGADLLYVVQRLATEAQVELPCQRQHIRTLAAEGPALQRSFGIGNFPSCLNTNIGALSNDQASSKVQMPNISEKALVCSGLKCSPPLRLVWRDPLEVAVGLHLLLGTRQPPQRLAPAR